MESPREIAVRVLLRRLSHDADYVERLLETDPATAHLSRQDRALCQELVYGCVRWQMTLDWLLSLKTSPRPQIAKVRQLLHLGFYQIFWLDRIPAHAAVHETVQLAKKMGCADKAGFINAVLRGFVRERDRVKARLETLKTTDPAVGFSHPRWLVDRWLAHSGHPQTQALLQWNNSPPPTFARLNRLKTDAAKLLAGWEAQGIGYTPHQWDWTGPDSVFELKSHPPLGDWPDFQNGYFYIQDPSTLLAVAELDPQPGERILDLCAAPGGKTNYIAQRMQNHGQVYAHDNQPERLQRLRENCARLGVTCVEPVQNIEPAEPFDRVLVDAPCSNTGVLRRRVDLRWRVSAEELGRLSRAQEALLSRAANWVKPGGTLVYSTCSLEPEENEKVIGEFLGKNPEFKLKKQRQLHPVTDQVDGAFTAALQHQGSPPA